MHMNRMSHLVISCNETYYLLYFVICTQMFANTNDNNIVLSVSIANPSHDTLRYNH